MASQAPITSKWTENDFQAERIDHWLVSAYAMWILNPGGRFLLIFSTAWALIIMFVFGISGIIKWLDHDRVIGVNMPNYDKQDMMAINYGLFGIGYLLRYLRLDVRCYRNRSTLPRPPHWFCYF
jgi:hypothetical protein